MSPDASPAPTSWQRFKDGVEVTSKIATVVLTGIALYATYAYNRQQDNARAAREREQAALQQVQTILGLFEPLSSADPKKHSLAVLTVKELTANVPLAIKLCLAAASQAECDTTASGFDVAALIQLSRDSTRAGAGLQQTALAALDVRQAAPDLARGRPQLTATPLPLSSGNHDDSLTTPGTRSGWVFVGTYSDSNWVTRYLDFPLPWTPASLDGKTLRVRSKTGALNVRANLFYEPGYDRIIDVLSAGSAVALDSVSSYANGGYYIWAHAHYRVTRP